MIVRMFQMRQKTFIISFSSSRIPDFTNMRKTAFKFIVSQDLINAFFSHFVGFFGLCLQYSSLLFSSYYLRVLGEDIYLFDNGIWIRLPEIFLNKFKRGSLLARCLPIETLV